MTLQPVTTPGAYPTLHQQLPTGSLTLKVDHARFPLDTLLGFAARANAKRGFLFLSKVLGKHWPAQPRQMAALHADLAAQIPADLPGPVVFIAMAETAIGLGQGVFEAWLAARPERGADADQALFLHSSRYRIGDLPFFEFEEAHSHAPRQFLHLSDAASALLERAGSLVLVDDEASTGNTFVNLAAVCRARYPSLARLHLAVITNFMGEQANSALSQRFSLPTTIGAALSGQYSFTPDAAAMTAAAAATAAAPAQRFEADAERGASAAFGRVGLTAALPAPAALAQRLAAGINTGERVLVLGTGEFMHPPYLLARALEALGIDVVVQSTTRSPILRWGAVDHILGLPDNYGEGVPNYLYNVAPGQYEHVFICHETPANPALFQLAGELSARLLHFMSETQIEEISVR
jgi:hypothetical protein